MVELGQLVNTWSWTEVERIFPADVVADETLVTEFLLHPQVVQLVRAITRKGCNRFRINMPTHGEDFEAECRILLWTMLVDPAARASAMRLRQGLAVALYSRYMDRMKQITESPAWVGSRGMSTQVRRHRALMMHASVLRNELGRDPSPAEVVAGYNAKVVVARKDAARQGMIATEADFDELAPAMLDTTLDVESAGHGDDVPLASTEARPLLQATLRAAGQVSSLLRDVIEAWLGHFDDDPPYIATVEEICEQTGLSDDVVRNLLVQAQTVCRQVAADEFDIHDDTRSDDDEEGRELRPTA